MGAIQKWRNTKTKSICSQNQVLNLKRHECNPKSNVRKSAQQKLSTVESDIDVSKIKLSANDTATTSDAPFIFDQKRGHCDPKSNVRKSAWQKLSMVESVIYISKIKLSASDTDTMADGPSILDQKCDNCYLKSNVQKSARQKLSMVESDINVSKIKSSASNTATKTTELTASHTGTKTASTIATKAATTADGPFNWKKMLDKLGKASSYDKIVQLVLENVLPPIELNKKYQQSSDDKTDPVAMHFFPNDHPLNVVPTQTLGDGNCFPRALSNALFGT